jgi:hypothetical protein
MLRRALGAHVNLAGIPVLYLLDVHRRFTLLTNLALHVKTSPDYRIGVPLLDA